MNPKIYRNKSGRPIVYQDREGKLRAVKCGCNTGGLNHEMAVEFERGAEYINENETEDPCYKCGFFFYYTTKRKATGNMTGLSHPERGDRR